METEKSVAHPGAQDVTPDEEDALASEVEPEDMDAFSMEEGDDSVFFNDDEEEQALQDMREAVSCAFGARECRVGRLGSLVSNEAAEASIPQKNNDIGAEAITDKDDSQTEKKVSETGKGVQAEQEEETTELETQPERSTSSGKGEKQDVVLSPQELIEEQTAKTDVLDVSKEGRDSELNGEAEAPEQISSDEVHISGESQDELDLELHHSGVSHTGAPQDSGPGYSTLPLPKTSGRTALSHKKSFNHHISSKYNTVSYRKIRRGNTRQKIEEFESMMINL